MHIIKYSPLTLFSSPKWSELFSKARQSWENNKGEGKYEKTLKKFSFIKRLIRLDKRNCSYTGLIMFLLSTVPSPSFPACSAAPPCRILVRTFSPSAGAWPAAALPIATGLLPIPTGAALDPASNNNNKSNHQVCCCLHVVYGNRGRETYRCLLKVVWLFWWAEELLALL